jgi:hypothetical protein
MKREQENSEQGKMPVKAHVSLGGQIFWTLVLLRAKF